MAMTSLRVARLTVGLPTLTPIAIAALFFLACSGTPAVRLGRATFEKKITSESQGQIALTNFTKTNGVQREVAGQRVYTMEFTSTLRFETGGWKGGDAFAGYFNTFTVLPGKVEGWSAFGQSWKYFERNAELQADGEIQFEDTENGWRPTVVEVKKVAVLSNRPDEQYYDRFVGFWANRDHGRPDLRILKDQARYKSVDQTNHSETNLSAENQALTYRELDMPVYMHLDERGTQLHAGVLTYDRIEDEAAYKKVRTQEGSPVKGTVAPAISAPIPAPHDIDPFTLQAVIHDPDGYTNVRAAPSAGAQVVGIMREGELFRTFTQDGEWWQVKLANGKTGYMHRSRITLRQ